MHVYTYLGYFNKLFNESAPGSGVTDGADLTSHPVANLYGGISKWCDTSRFECTSASNKKHTYTYSTTDYLIESVDEGIHIFPVWFVFWNKMKQK